MFPPKRARNVQQISAIVNYMLEMLAGCVKFKFCLFLDYYQLITIILSVT